MGRQHYGGICAAAGPDRRLGRYGRAQPLAATMAGASMPAIECQPSRIQKRLDTRYLDVVARDLDEALGIIQRSTAELHAGLSGFVVRQCGRDPAGVAAAGSPPRCRDRSDIGARSGQRLFARRLDAGTVGGTSAERSGGGGSGRQNVPWRYMCRRCWNFIVPACRLSTMAITSCRWRCRKASRTRSPFLPTFCCTTWASSSATPTHTPSLQAYATPAAFPSRGARPQHMFRHRPCHRRAVHTPALGPAYPLICTTALPAGIAEAITMHAGQAEQPARRFTSLPPRRNNSRRAHSHVAACRSFK